MRGNHICRMPGFPGGPILLVGQLDNEGGAIGESHINWPHMKSKRKDIIEAFDSAFKQVSAEDAADLLESYRMRYPWITQYWDEVNKTLSADQDSHSAWPTRDNADGILA